MLLHGGCYRYCSSNSSPNDGSGTVAFVRVGRKCIELGRRSVVAFIVIAVSMMLHVDGYSYHSCSDSHCLC